MIEPIAEPVTMDEPQPIRRFTEGEPVVWPHQMAMNGVSAEEWDRTGNVRPEHSHVRYFEPQQ